MNVVKSTKALVLSAVAGAAIVGGGLLLTGGIASAADPTPTPAPQQQQTQPAQPGQQNNGQHDPANCPNMGNDNGGSGTAPSGSGTGLGFRGMSRGPRA
jgi:hypothetical protein